MARSMWGTAALGAAAFLLAGCTGKQGAPEGAAPAEASGGANESPPSGDREVVFRLEGLTCCAVDGLG